MAKKALVLERRCHVDRTIDRYDLGSPQSLATAATAEGRGSL